MQFQGAIIEDGEGHTLLYATEKFVSVLRKQKLTVPAFTLVVKSIKPVPDNGELESMKFISITMKEGTEVDIIPIQKIVTLKQSILTYEE